MHLLGSEYVGNLCKVYRQDGKIRYKVVTDVVLTKDQEHIYYLNGPSAADSIAEALSYAERDVSHGKQVWTNVDHVEVIQPFEKKATLKFKI